MEGVVRRLPAKPTHVPTFRYLTVSDSLASAQSSDMVSLKNFHRSKDALKQKLRNGLGIEFLASGARKLNGNEVSRWLGDLREAYAFCESAGCQFILSSGAASPLQMISGKSFDAILDEIGIDHQKYWRRLEIWLKDVISRKVVVE